MRRRRFIRNSFYSGVVIALRVRSGGRFLKIGYREGLCGFDYFSIDGLGKGLLDHNVVLPPENEVLSGWKLKQGEEWFELSGGAEPFCFNIHQQSNHATLLGMMKGEVGELSLPAVLHFPDMGSLRVTASVP